MIKDAILKERKLENCGLICKRDRSHIYKVRHIETGAFFCLKRLTDDKRFSYTYEQSYINYAALRSKCGKGIPLVHVFDAWRDKEGVFYVLMEYLDGYTRLEYAHMDPRVDVIEKHLIKNGYFMIDLAPINFMVKGDDIKMVDLDTMAKIDDFPVDAHEPLPELSWYGSRVLKHKSGRLK